MERGASKFIEYKVTKAISENVAMKLVRAISDSTLVKTAMFWQGSQLGEESLLPVEMQASASIIKKPISTWESANNQYWY